MSRHRHTHQPDRTGSGDQHVLTEHRKGQCRVNSISKWIEDGSNILIDGGAMPPYSRHGQRDVLRIGSGTIHAHSLRVRAKMTPPRQAMTAAAASDVSFPAH